MAYNVLVLGPGKRTLGGITSVIRAYNSFSIWNKYRCIWIETHIDANIFIKFSYFIRSLFKFMVFFPKCTIVHIHFSEPKSLMRKTIFFIISKMFNKSVVAHFHSFSAETTLKGPYQVFYKFIFNMSDHVIVLSNYWANEIKRTLKCDEKISIIHNPCVKNRFSCKKKKNVKYILYAGTLNQRKGFMDLIKAFSLIYSNNKDWYLYLAGNGDTNKAIKYSCSLGISDRVKVLGWVNGAKKDIVYAEASIFCLPSYAEGFPVSILDAIAVSLPIITTPVGGIPDVLINNVNSLLFEPGNINELSFLLNKLIADENLYKKLSKESLKLSNTLFSEITIQNSIENIYRKYLTF
jgi:glycosyltransferase involved in cell wall biosynthesis